MNRRSYEKLLLVLFLMFYSSNAIAMTIEELNQLSEKYNSNNNDKDDLSFSESSYLGNERDLIDGSFDNDFTDAQEYLYNNPTVKCVSIDGWAYIKQPDGSIGEEIDKPSYKCKKLK